MDIKILIKPILKKFAKEMKAKGVNQFIIQCDLLNDDLSISKFVEIHEGENGEKKYIDKTEKFKSLK